MNLRKFVIIFMLSFILKLFGCISPKKNSDAVSKKDSISASILKSVDDFKSRPIYKKMTVEIIDTINDDKLLQTIFDNLCEKLPKDNTKELEVIANLSKAKQAIYVIWQLEAEVNNGGFNQFYYNSSGQFANIIPDALNMVGANKFSDLVERANAIYKRDYDKITKYQDGSIKGFSKSYDDNALNDLDKEFFALYKEEDLYKLQVDFIRRNKQQFID
jgi:hypothetical protein